MIMQQRKFGKVRDEISKNPKTNKRSKNKKKKKKKQKPLKHSFKYYGCVRWALNTECFMAEEIKTKQNEQKKKEKILKAKNVSSS